MLRKLTFAGVFATAAVFLAACRDSLPQSSLNPAGPVAEEQANLFIMVFWIAVVVFVLVEGALVYFIWRYRHRPGAKANQSHGNTAVEITLTIIPTLLLAAIAVPTVAGIWKLSDIPSGPDVLRVDVVGHQWWWEFRYRDHDIVTANDMVIPEDTQVTLRLCSFGATGRVDPDLELEPGALDGSAPAPNAMGPAIGQPCVEIPNSIGNAVIHAFWVPRLAGKQDVMPGQTNEMYLSADAPGVYPGQCAEYCAWSHALMRFQVIAKTQADFDTWVREQQAEATVASDSLAVQGATDFAEGKCINCHTINGLTNEAGAPVAGSGGPDLTHLASRDCFAGCVIKMYNEDGSFNEAGMRAWLDDPQSIKAGAKMPDYDLTPEQLDAMIAYLEGLS